MIQIDKQLIQNLIAKAEESNRKRMNYDFRTSVDDNSQRMLNALLPGTVVPIHRHPMSNENVICLCGKLVEVLYEDVVITQEGQTPMCKNELRETARYTLDPSVGNFGCVVPAGVWHTVEVLEPSVIYEAKDGAYGSDGSESFDPHKKLKQDITYLVGMERQSGSMEVCSPLYVSRMLNVPLEDVEKAMREMGV